MISISEFEALYAKIPKIEDGYADGDDVFVRFSNGAILESDLDPDYESEEAEFMMYSYRRNFECGCRYCYWSDENGQITNSTRKGFKCSRFHPDEIFNPVQ